MAGAASSRRGRPSGGRAYQRRGSAARSPGAVGSERTWSPARACPRFPVGHTEAVVPALTGSLRRKCWLESEKRRCLRGSVRQGLPQPRAQRRSRAVERSGFGLPRRRSARAEHRRGGRTRGGGVLVALGALTRPSRRRNESRPVEDTSSPCSKAATVSPDGKDIPRSPSAHRVPRDGGSPRRVRGFPMCVT